MSLAAALFADLGTATRVGSGIVRDSYGAGEQAGHDLVRTAAAALGLEIAIDAIGNLMMTLTGSERDAPGIIIGSHLDSTPQGGNFDGAAGVVAGLSALAGLRRAGITPRTDLTVMAIRGEESSWFDIRRRQRLAHRNQPRQPRNLVQHIRPQLRIHAARARF